MSFADPLIELIPLYAGYELTKEYFCNYPLAPIPASIVQLLAFFMFYYVNRIFIRFKAVSVSQDVINRLVTCTWVFTSSWPLSCLETFHHHSFVSIFFYNFSNTRFMVTPKDSHGFPSMIHPWLIYHHVIGHSIAWPYFTKRYVSFSMI